MITFELFKNVLLLKFGDTLSNIWLGWMTFALKSVILQNIDRLANTVSRCIILFKENIFPHFPLPVFFQRLLSIQKIRAFHINGLGLLKTVIKICSLASLTATKKQKLVAKTITAKFWFLNFFSHREPRCYHWMDCCLGSGPEKYNNVLLIVTSH